MAARHTIPRFGHVLRAHRTTCGLTQEELADRSGLSVRAIRNLEIGRTGRPQQQSVALLVTALRLSEEDRAALLAAAGRGTPHRPGRCELPPDVPKLVGRDSVVGALTHLLTTDGQRLGLVSGGPGSGRTAVAVRVAHRVRERFPDGQVYADLDRPDGLPLRPDAVLGRVLRSLGATDLPPSRDERAALLRADLAARRVLVVLDNVAAEAQVRPLLTGHSRSAVLLTSRRQLVALPGLRPVRLDPLDAGHARHLLALLAGDRVHAERAAAAAVAAACGGRPLALHIAGTWLAARPGRTVGDLAELLADEDLRLDRLTVADLSVRASIAAHVAELGPDERRLLHQLSHVGAPALTAENLCHRLAAGENDLRDRLDQLAHANLLTPAGAGYRMDPLVRRYALEDAGLPRLRAAR